MTSKPVALLWADLGATKTHSRPHVSNDNPYSEARFKTMKYRPDYPARFGCLQDARTWATEFFNWYNREHHHTGLALLTPADVHFRRAEDVLQKRQAVLQAAYEKTPERFVKGAHVPSNCQKLFGLIRQYARTTAFIEPPPEMKTRTATARAPFPFRLGQLPFYSNFITNSLPVGVTKFSNFVSQIMHTVGEFIMCASQRNTDGSELNCAKDAMRVRA